MASSDTWFKIQIKKTEREGYKRRKEQVGQVKGKIGDVSDDYVNSINGKIEKLNGSLSTAIKGLNVIETLQNATSEKKEKVGTGDSFLANCSSELSSEISDCKTKIESLDDEISRLQKQYESEIHAEREAARKAAERIANMEKKLLGL